MLEIKIIIIIYGNRYLWYSTPKIFSLFLKKGIRKVLQYRPQGDSGTGQRKFAHLVLDAAGAVPLPGVDVDDLEVLGLEAAPVAELWLEVGKNVILFDAIFNFNVIN